jgi:hypothetical protein
MFTITRETPESGVPKTDWIEIYKEYPTNLIIKNDNAIVVVKKGIETKIVIHGQNSILLQNFDLETMHLYTQWFIGYRKNDPEMMAVEKELYKNYPQLASFAYLKFH